MPNQRHSNKKMIGAYVWENDLTTLQKIASDYGVTQASVIKAMIAGLDEMDNEARQALVNAAKKQDHE